MMANPKEPVAVDRAHVAQAFHRWAAETHPNMYAALRKISVAGESMFALVHDAIDELIELRQPAFEDWYMRNSYRYQRARELERRRVIMLAREFFSQLQLGKVDV